MALKPGAMTTDRSNVDVQLTRMEGSIERILDGMRRTEQDVLHINTRMNTHSERIGTLERERSERAGAQSARDQMSKYAVLLSKMVWTIIGLVVAGTAALIARILHI